MNFAAFIEVIKRYPDPFCWMITDDHVLYMDMSSWAVAAGNANAYTCSGRIEDPQTQQQHALLYTLQTVPMRTADGSEGTRIVTTQIDIPDGDTYPQLFPPLDQITLHDVQHRELMLIFQPADPGAGGMRVTVRSHCEARPLLRLIMDKMYSMISAEQNRDNYNTIIERFNAHALLRSFVPDSVVQALQRISIHQATSNAGRRSKLSRRRRSRSSRRSRMSARRPHNRR